MKRKKISNTIETISTNYNVAKNFSSGGYHSTVYKEVFPSKELQYTLLNPFFGLLFKGSALHNMRLFYHNIDPTYKDCIIRERVHDTGKDMVAKLLIMLFPSPGGSLCTTTQWSENFAKCCFSRNSKTLKTNIKMLATTVAAIYNDNEVNYESWLGSLTIEEQNRVSKKEAVIIKTFMDCIQKSSSDDTELVLLTIHAFALEVLDTEEEYKLYLETVLKNTKDNDSIEGNSLATDVQVQNSRPRFIYLCIIHDMFNALCNFVRDNYPYSTKNVYASNSQVQKVRSDFINLCTKHDMFNKLCNSVIDNYPYSKKNMPASNSSIPEYIRATDTFSSSSTFADSADVTLLHLCNVLFYDEVLEEYNLDHLQLDDDSNLKKFYDKNKKPVGITRTIRNEWSRVIQCLNDLVITEKHNKNVGIIKYRKVKSDRKNEVKSEFPNVITILTRICMSNRNGIFDKYKELCNVKDLDKRDVFSRLVELLNSMTAKHITVTYSKASERFFGTENEYYGELYIDINYVKDTMKTSTTMMFSMVKGHANAEFISRETNHPPNILQSFNFDNLCTQLSCSECVLLAHIRDIQDAEPERTENNRFDVLYNQGRLTTSRQKVDHLKYLYNNYYDLMKKGLLDEVLLSRVTEMIVKSVALADIKTENMFRFFFVNISSLVSRLGSLDSKKRLYGELNWYRSTGHSKSSYMHELWDRMICTEMSTLDKIVINDLPYAKVVWILRNTEKIAKYKSIEILVRRILADFTDLCKALQKHVYVECLKFRNHDLTAAEVRTVIESLLCNECRINTIREITDDEISRIDSDDTYESLKSILKTMCIETPMSQSHKQQCGCLMKSASNLTSLETCFDWEEDECVRHLASILINEDCHLTSLDLYCRKVSLKGIMYLCGALNYPKCKLTSFRCTGFDTISTYMKYLSAVLMYGNCTLKRLDISYSPRLVKSIKLICGALESENCQLTELQCNSNDFGASNAELISKALKHKNCRLTIIKY